MAPGVASDAVPALTRFFQTLPLADPRDSRTFFDELSTRLPRRGVARWREACLSERLERILEGRPAAHEDPAQAALVAERLGAETRRRDECAQLIQRAVLPFLYAPRHGCDPPMLRRYMREDCAVLSETDESEGSVG